MIGPNSVFADFRFPRCNALQSASRMLRRLEAGQTGGHYCARGGQELRLCEAGQSRHRLLFAVVALSTGLFGFWVTSFVPGLTFMNPAGVEKLNLTGFVTVMLLAALPATALRQRILKVETVE